MRIPRTIVGKIPAVIRTTAFSAVVSTASVFGYSPEGYWKTIDDKTGKAKAIIHIQNEGGVLNGRVEKLFPEPGHNPDPKCRKCDGDLKDKPVKGLRLIWGLGEKDGEWSGGYILDPESGRTYRCKLKPLADGDHLLVRGYLGISLLGRSQTWIRTTGSAD